MDKITALYSEALSRWHEIEKDTIIQEVHREILGDNTLLIQYQTDAGWRIGLFAPNTRNKQYCAVYDLLRSTNADGEAWEKGRGYEKH